MQQARPEYRRMLMADAQGKVLVADDFAVDRPISARQPGLYRDPYPGALCTAAGLYC